MDQQKAVEQNSKEASLLEKKIHRRKFFKFSSVAVASAAFIASCDKDDDDDDGVNYNCFIGAGFNFPVHTGLPCIRRTAYIIPTMIKKNGPRKPRSATNFVP